MLKEKLKGYTIILASGSPRRQQFMKDLDIDFEIRLKDVEEVYPESLKGTEITDYLAVLKADSLKDSLADDEIVITSDTIVWHEDKALGKPKDYDDAVTMLQSLSGKTHQVITSVCVMDNKHTETFNDTTHVTFHSLTDEEIKYYIDNYSPFDKAGAYGIQEWIGLVAIAKIEGSYANVVGMPVDKVYRHLINFI
ncbi:septum formation protein Maf [Flavobacterium salilacus subsp. salilacus]|uniref:Maf-like protein n=1 Tax=Flavobacterium TaxID=237 RepID=UPI001074FBC1|nr:MULTISPECIES: Maf-like protein [Flavobacterium]KAF2518588.1 septum formation protein Maf [Flavobacterium salilacus subsp. salilacus]MBE1613544.1 septum formation protein Maf [Flavobacterium sp. SaA2.13]